MSGIEKMTEQIRADAREEASDILRQAESEAEAEKAKAAQKETGRREKAEAELEKELRDYRERAASARDLSRRRMILERKQEIISALIDRTRDKLKEADTPAYFDMLRSMAARFAHEGDGRLYLNAADLKRMPADFPAQADAAAQKHGGHIEVAQEPGDIADGFLLVYGGTQENCTFEALIETEKDRMQDEVNRMLWRDGNG